MNSIDFQWHDVVGLFGVAIILTSYLGLQAGKLQADRLPYQIANIIGSAAILISLLYNFNLSGFVIQIAWILISIYGIIRVIMLRSNKKPE